MTLSHGQPGTDAPTRARTATPTPNFGPAQARARQILDGARELTPDALFAKRWAERIRGADPRNAPEPLPAELRALQAEIGTIQEGALYRLQSETIAAARATVGKATEIETEARRKQGGARDTVGSGVLGDAQRLVELAKTFLAAATAEPFDIRFVDRAQIEYDTKLARVEPLVIALSPCPG